MDEELFTKHCKRMNKPDSMESVDESDETDVSMRMQTGSPLGPLVSWMDSPGSAAEVRPPCEQCVCRLRAVAPAQVTLRSAAHLHLLGEALLLIGHYLQETDKLVCVSTSVSLLLDSLLCSLAPLMSLSSQIPELQSCVEHSVAPTLENVSYLMPGLNGDSSSELRLILLGNIGCGKTSSADTILDQQAPLTLSSSKCLVQREGFVEGRRVTVVEAPRWYWSRGQMDESVRKETEKALMLLAPGPHTLLLLIPVFQFTEMETLVPGELEALFGKDVLNHTLILFTCGDYLMGKTLEEYFKKEPPALLQIIEQCNGRCHVINNRKRQDRRQVQQLLNKVDDIVQRNGIHSLKTADERDIEKRIQERKCELMESYRAQREAQRLSISPVLDNGTEIRQTTSPKMERIGRERDAFEAQVESHQESNRVHSSPAKEHNTEHQSLQMTPSYRLNSDGAVLSQMSETRSTPKVTSTSTARSASSSGLQTPELRLVLVGRSGAGKSAVGNCILGHGAFRSDQASFTAVTQDCEKKRAEVSGRKVAVVDTPDWFNSEKTPDEVRAQISSCVTLSSPGPHAFLMCIPVDQSAKTELQALQALGSVFGTDAVQKHTIAVFTFSDRLQESGKAKNKSVEAYISSERPDLLNVVEKCRDRFHIMEMGKGGNNVAELLEMIDQTVKEAGGQCYSSAAFQEAEDKVRQRQFEIAREQRGLQQESYKPGDLRLLNSEKRQSFSYMQPLKEEMDEEMERTRDEAEMSVSTMNIESLPPVLLSNFSPSMLQYVRDKMELGMKSLPELFSTSSSWVSKGAESVKGSPMWGKVGSGALNVQKIVVDSSVWEKVGAKKGELSKAVGGKIPKVVLDGSAWVGSGAKAAAASPVWGKVGSGANLVARNSVRLGSGLGTGAKNLAQSPVWGKMGSGAKTGAKMVVESPVWGKVGSGAKTGAKMVAESPVWEKIGQTAKQVPKVVIAGAVLGLVLGVLLGGVIGGAIGAGAGSALTEVGRRKLGNKKVLEQSNFSNVERNRFWVHPILVPPYSASARWPSVRDGTFPKPVASFLFHHILHPP
uniref:AIG1-type G domain-containing protein n=1 Tax=Knipowitschia caucasica TaxID=637954 RepID=A0AAV2LK73_KNICA